MKKLAVVLIPAVLVSGSIGFIGGRYSQDMSEATAIQVKQLEIMQKQQAEADQKKANARKMIGEFTKSRPAN